MKNFIFDFYNTLADTRTDEHRVESWAPVAEYLAKLGIAAAPEKLIPLYDMWWERVNADMSGGKYAYPEGDIKNVYKYIAHALGGKLTDKQAARCAAIARKASIVRFETFSGTRRLLTELRLRGGRLFILSNAQSVFTAPEIESTGLADLFDGIMLSSDCGCRKPDPAFFGMLFDKYGLDKSESVMIGDDEYADGKGAFDFGIKYIKADGGAAAHADEILGAIK